MFCQSRKVFTLFIFISFLFSSHLSYSAPASIHLNQIGFLPNASKIAVVPNVESGEFWLFSVDKNTELLRGPLSQPQAWAVSGETVKIADFSAFNVPGRYFIRVVGAKDSAVFEIGSGMYDKALTAAIKSYYYNRSGVAIEPRFGGEYARPAGHPDSLVYIHPSAASASRPVGTTISSEKGWYDAGDYNKYIVNSGITTYTLLKAYQDYESYFKSLKLNIPESKNKTPDFLDEILWNLEWMRSMQDPADGGVYHKLTTLKFTSKGMPHEQNQARYVVQKSTAAALNFVAVMARASSLFAQHEDLFPGHAQSYKQVALNAWAWAVKNPKLMYLQPKDVKTGIYANVNDDFKDEWLWAAVELFVLTGKKSYLDGWSIPKEPRTLEWGRVENLALFTLAEYSKTPSKMKKQAIKQLKAMADGMVRDLWASGYFVPMLKEDFVWGSNAIALNKAMVLLHANKVAPNPEYEPTARALVDYVFGRNPTGYSFVTGFGSRPPMGAHHRVSYYDEVKAPVPGMLVGGPHSGQQDTCKYPSKLPAKSYFDGWCSYSTNEIAINWNAPLVYVLAGLRVVE